MQEFTFGEKILKLLSFFLLLRCVWFGREVGKREVGKREYVKREKDEKYRRFDVLFRIRERREK